MDAVLNAESNDGIALLKLRIPINEVALTVADKATEGCVEGEFEFANGFLAHPAVLGNLDFSYVSIGDGE